MSWLGKKLFPNSRRSEHRKDTATLIAWLIVGLILGASIAVLLLYLYNRPVP